MRYFFHIAYNGTNYRGWQRLPGITSVQETIESVLSKVLKTPLTIVGCGRTDAQVHATQYFFHVDIETPWDFDLKFRLNKVLPPDISVFDIIPMEGLPHARFDAYTRSYDYFIHSHKDPFLNLVSSCYDIKNADLKSMAAAASILPNYKDYLHFCRTPDKHPSTICQVSAAQLYSNPEGDKLRFQISANRFLKGMIRLLVAKLLEIGNGQLTFEQFENSLKYGEKLPEIISAYPKGLYLSKVTYPYLDLPAGSSFNPTLPHCDWQPVLF